MRLDSFKAIDNSVTKTMLKFSKPALRFSLAIIFIWFGALKPLGLSPAEGLLKDTVSWLPFGKPEFWATRNWLLGSMYRYLLSIQKNK